MLLLVASDTGGSLFLLFGKMEQHIHWMKVNCPWSCHTWTVTNPDQRVKGHWQILKNGPSSPTLLHKWRRELREFLNIRCIHLCSMNWPNKCAKDLPKPRMNCGN